MKIIFLDLDGVLIKFGDTPLIRKTRADKLQKGLVTELDEDLVDNLIYIITQTDAHIVVSSSWRRSMFDKLRDEFYKNGERRNFDLWNRVISKTPDSLGYGRGNEILTWLNDYHKTCKEGYHITHWAVIDDDTADLKCVSRLGKLVNTETHEGLTKDKTEEVIKLLNN